MKGLRTQSPLLLSVASGAGVLTTAYLSARAGYKSAEVIKEQQDGSVTTNSDFKRRVQLTWKLYIPPAGAVGASIACIVASSRVSGRRIAAAQTAASISAAAFEQYRGKVAELFGDGKEQKVRDELAGERVLSNPPPAGIVVTGNKVICCELFTGRYFESDMETLRRAQNECNARAIREKNCMLTEFYWLVGLDVTSQSGEIGWENWKPMELRFSTVLTPDNRPCLTFEYNYIQTI